MHRANEAEVERLCREVEQEFGKKRGRAKAATGERMARPTFSEPEGGPPGRRPSAGEPDDPTSPRGFSQSQPIGFSPGHAKVPTEEMAHGVPTPEPLDEYAMRLSVVSAARALSGQMHRPQEDLEGMIWEETGRKLRAGVWPIAVAIMEAKDAVRTAIRNGDR